MHISGGRTSKSEIRKQKSQIILADGESFNEVDDRSNIGPITIDKRVIRGQMVSTKVNRQDTEPDYSPDILDNSKLNTIIYLSQESIVDLRSRTYLKREAATEVKMV